MNKGRGFLMVLAIGVVLALGPVLPTAFAAHKAFRWDRNVEADMKEYHFYTCPLGAPVCDKTTGTQIAVIPQVPVGTIPVFVPAHGIEGDAFVTAVDTADNESGESNVVAFDLVPPFGPQNHRFEKK